MAQRKPSRREEESERRSAIVAQQEVILALVRACRDDLRPAIRREGIDERDLAFEASLLAPAEVENPTYGTRKRNGVLRILRGMQRQGLITMETGPRGAYRVLPTSQGEKYAEYLMRPWWRRLWDRLRRRGARGR